MGVPLAIVSSIVVSRALGVEGRGEYSLVLLVGSLLLTFMSFGVPSAIVYFVGSGQVEAARAIKSCAFLALALGLAGIGVVHLLELAHLLRPVLGADNLTPAAQIVVYTFPLVLFGSLLMNILLAEGKLRLFYGFPLVCQGVSLIAVMLVIVTRGLDVVTAVGITIGIQILGTVSILLTREDRGRIVGSRILSARETAAMVRYAGISHAGNVVQVLNYRTSTFVVNHFLGFAGVGLYTLATGLAEMLWLISRPAATVLFPRTAALKDQAAQIKLIASGLRLVFYMTLMAGVATAVVVPFAIPLFYGTDFADAVKPFLWLLPGVVIFSISNVVASLWSGIGRPSVNLAGASISLAVGVSLVVLLVPRLGLSGAAVGVSLGYVVASAFMVFRLHQAHGRSGLAFLRPPTLSEAESLLRGGMSRGAVG